MNKYALPIVFIAALLSMDAYAQQAAAYNDSGCTIEGKVLSTEKLPSGASRNSLYRNDLEVAGNSGFLVFYPDACKGKFRDGYRFQAITENIQPKTGETIKGRLNFKANANPSGYYLEEVSILSMAISGVQVPTIFGILNVAVKNIVSLAVLGVIAASLVVFGFRVK